MDSRMEQATEGPEDITIEQYTAGDIPADLYREIVRLLESQFPVFDERDAAVKDEEIKLFQKEGVLEDELQDSVFFLAKDADKVVGFLNCSLDQQLCFVYWIIVDKDSQRKGIATKLHAAYETQFVNMIRSRSHRDIIQRLVCDDRNAAFPLYQKLGYTETHKNPANEHKRHFVKRKQEN
jgi:ribosomal protein S18 acetylase RimI-like enzyme